MALKFSANLGFLFATKDANILDKFRLAARAGFRGIEGPFPEGFELSEVKNVLNETGIEFNLINMKTEGVPNGQFGSASFPDYVEDFRSNFETTLKFAKELHCKKIHVMSGKLEHPPTEENFATYISNLQFVAEKIKYENIVAVIEPINRYSVPGYFLNDYDKAIEILKSVNSKKVKLMADIFHMQLIQGDITNTIQSLMPFIGHVQIAQAPSRHEPNAEGELNYRYIFKLLMDSGYHDWVGCEYKPIDTTENGLGWVQEFGFEL